MSVRSKKLAMLNLPPAALTTVYTVPNGYRTIVKQVTLHNGSTGGRDLELQFAGITYYTEYTVPSRATRTFPLWLVLDQGDTIKAQTSGTGSTCFAAGAELLLP